MTDKIDQSNLYLLLPFKISHIADMVQEDLDIGPVDAIRLIYASETYSKLEREESKAWNLGPTTLYYDLAKERGKR